MTDTPKNEALGTFGVILMIGTLEGHFVPEEEYLRINSALWSIEEEGENPDEIFGFEDLYGGHFTLRLSEIAGCYLNTPEYRLSLSKGRLENREAWEEVELHTGERLPDWADS